MCDFLFINGYKDWIKYNHKDYCVKHGVKCRGE